MNLRPILFKSTPFLLVSFLLFPLSSFAITIGPSKPGTIEWNANTEPDMSHYNLYYNGNKVAEVPHSFDQSITVQAPTPPSDGDYQVWVTAVDTSQNESLPSNTVTFTWDAGAPVPPTITIIVQ